MMCHDAHTFKERCTVMASGKPFRKIVREHLIGINNLESSLFGQLEESDAPVEICRIAIMKVIGHLTGKVGTDIEGLVTDKHTADILPPMELFGCL